MMAIATYAPLIRDRRGRRRHPAMSAPRRRRQPGAYDRPVAESPPSPDPRAALLAEREQVLAEIAGIDVQGPGQMTYGSQAAAATHVFEQQRDLALRDRNGSTSPRSTPRSSASTPAPTAPARRAASRSRPSASRRCRRRRCASTASARRAGDERAGPDEGAAAASADASPPRPSSASTRSVPRRRPSTASPLRTPLVPFGAPDRNQWLKAEIAPADRRVQDPRRLRRRRVAGARRPGTGPDHLLLGQPRPGGRPRRPAARRPGGHRDALRRARPIKRARVEADGAQVVMVGHRVRRAAAGRRGARRVARARDDPALRRPADHRRPGHGGPRDRRGLPGRRRGARADRRRRPGQRGRRGDPGPRARTRA